MLTFPPFCRTSRARRARQPSERGALAGKRRMPVLDTTDLAIEQAVASDRCVVGTDRQCVTEPVLFDPDVACRRPAVDANGLMERLFR